MAQVARLRRYSLRYQDFVRLGLHGEILSQIKQPINQKPITKKGSLYLFDTPFSQRTATSKTRPQKQPNLVKYLLALHQWWSKQYLWFIWSAGVRDTDQQLKALDALEELSSFPAPTWMLITTYNSRPRRSDALLWRHTSMSRHT